MAQRRCATPRIADELVLVPPRGSPHRKSTCPRCENVLAPFATRRCSYTCEAGNVEHQLDERTRPDHEASTCTRALPPRQKNPPAANSRGIVWSMARSAADFRRADQEACQCRQQPQGAEHVPQEHEGQQDTHVSLEFDVREDPGCHTDGQGKAGKGYRLACGLQRFVVGLLQRQALTQVGFQTAVDIDTVVNTDTHTQRDHRQGRHLHTNAQEGHQRVGQNRGQRQRDDDTEYRRDRTEGRQTHQDHHHVHGDQHLDLGLLDDHVGSSLDTRVTGSQFELQVLVVVLLGEGFDLSGHALEGFSLVVVEEHHHRCQGAGSVEHAFRSTADGGVQVVLVTRQGLPFQAALVVTHDHLLGDRHQGHRGLHAGQVGHAPFQLVDGFHGLVRRAHFRRGADHHHQYVRAGRVVADDEVVIHVVAGVGMQLRCTRIQVTDLHLLAMVDTEGKGDHGDDHGDRCNGRMCEARQTAPQTLGTRVEVAIALDSALADTDEGHQGRQQHQVGEDDDAHTYGGGDTQLADNLDLDKQQRGETDTVGDQSHHAGNVQRSERTTGSGIGAVSSDRLHGHGVDDLHAVGDTDGKDQEGHQDRIGIQTITQGMQQAHLPDNGDDRARQSGQRTLQTAGEDQQQYEGDQQRDTEVHHHLDDTFDQVTHFLGEADDVDADVRVLTLEFAADLLFQQAGELAVIQLDQLALILRIGIGLLQRHLDDGGLEVVRHQTADFTGLEDVDPQVLQIFLGQIGRLVRDRAAIETVLGYLGPADVRCPQRAQVGAIHAGQEEHLVVDPLQGFHVLGREDVAILDGDGDPDGVTQVRHVIPVLDHVGDPGMLQRDHLVETGDRSYL